MRPYHKKYISGRNNRKLIIGIVCVLIVISVPLVVWLYSFLGQLKWSNALVDAIDCEDVAEVERLLNDKGKDINREGGGVFPIYILMPFDELMPSKPIEEAFFVGNTDIIKKVLGYKSEYGLEYDADELLELTLFGRNECNRANVELLIENSLQNNKKLKKINILIDIADYSTTEDDAEQETQKNITSVFDMINKCFPDSSDKYKVLEKSLDVASLSGNKFLEKYILNELKND